MAKVKTAKQRITDFLKAKGLDAAEIQDAFAELDAADADLDKLAEVTTQNTQWNTWYNQVAPALQEIVTERDTLKTQIEKLQSAGFSFEDAKQVVQHAHDTGLRQQPDAKFGGAGFDHAKFQNDITRATNDIMKNVARYGLKHYKEFQEELDYDEIEKLMGEKNIPFDVAYDRFVEPRREAKRTEEMTAKIKQGIQEGIQAELSKQGIRRTRKRTDDIDPAPLDKPAPSDSDLKDAFLRDLEEVTN